MLALTIPTGKINIYIRDYPHQGEAILFLHFSGANLMMWQSALPYFQNDYRLILVDLRGHGHSDKPVSGYHIDELAGDILAVMNQLELEQAHIMGCSMGAEVGLSLAANHPEKVLSFACEGALCSEYGSYGIWEGSQAAFDAHVATQLERIRSTPDAVFPSEEALMENFQKRIQMAFPWNRNFELMKRYDVYQTASGGFASGWGNLAKADYMQHYFASRFEDYYARVKCPLLMLPDAEDSQDERIQVTMNGFKDLAKQARIEKVPNWSHPYGWLLDPQAMCQTILRFFAETH